MIRQLWFWVLRKLNEGCPSRREISFLLSQRKIKLNARTLIALERYTSGVTFEQIAKELICTRMRARMLVYHGWHVMRNC